MKKLFLIVSCIMLVGQWAQGQSHPHIHRMGEKHLMKLETDPLTGKTVAVCNVAEESPEERAVFENLKYTAQSRIAMQRSTATITINYSGFTDEARAAFDKAVEIWAAELSSPVDIVVNANYTALGANVLGSASATAHVQNFTNAPLPNTAYPIALANALAGTDLNGGTAEITTNFSNQINWYFGTDGNPPAGRFDLVSVILHELGHGLGFAGSASISGANGSIGFGGNPRAYDRLVINGGGTSILTFTNPSADLAAQFTSNNLFLTGPKIRELNGGNPGKIFVPATFQPGSSYSHWDESTYNGTTNRLMTPQIAPGESIFDLGDLTRGLFQDMGWQFGVAFPRVSIVSNPTNANICSGTTIVFTATPVLGGTSPSYSWKRVRGGVTTTVGSNSPTLTVSDVQNGDRFFVVLTSSLPEAVNPTANSNQVTVTVRPSETATLSIVNNGNTTLTPTGRLVLSANTTGMGNNPTFRWLINGEVVRLGRNLDIPYSTVAALAGESATVTVNLEATASVDACGNEPVLLQSIDFELITSVQEVLSNYFEIYPNPIGNADNILKLSVNRPIQQVLVLDLHSKVLYDLKDVSENIELSLDEAPKGMLFVKLVFVEGVIAKKIVKL